MVLSLLLALLLLVGAAWTAPPVKWERKKLAAITFDDGPWFYTDSLLDGLKARNVKATFFILGERIDKYRSTVARIYKEGHQLANHSFSHGDLTALSSEGVRKEIRSTNEELDCICGKGISYLVRPPYGRVNPAVSGSVGAPMVLWSVDPRDWECRSSKTVMENIIGSVHDGAIILVHDIHSSSITGALAAIDYLKKGGYEFVTVGELFRRKGRALKDGVQYRKCPDTGKDLGPVSEPVIATEPVDGRLRVTIDAQAGAEVYYTTGPEELNGDSARYKDPFLVECPCRLRAVAAFDMNGGRSGTVEKVYTRPEGK